MPVENFDSLAEDKNFLPFPLKTFPFAVIGGGGKKRSELLFTFLLSNKGINNNFFVVGITRIFSILSP